jgi:type III pantothenate kinase
LQWLKLGQGISSINSSCADPLTSDNQQMTSTQQPVLWVLDLGNTRLKLARFVDGEFREEHIWLRKEDGQCLQWLLTQQSDGYVLLATGKGEKIWKKTLGEQAPVWSYEAGMPLPFELNYETPDTLGVDRLAAVAAAHALYPRTACLIIDAGTCITYEYLTAEGTYLGGSISPGLHMRLHAMHEFTGKLPLVPKVLPKGEIGTSTAKALQNGALRGALHEIVGIVSAFRQNQSHCKVLVCGGDMPFLRPHLPDGLVYRPSLVLEGLAKLHTYAISS